MGVIFVALMHALPVYIAAHWAKPKNKTGAIVYTAFGSALVAIALGSALFMYVDLAAIIATAVYCVYHIAEPAQNRERQEQALACQQEQWASWLATTINENAPPEVVAAGEGVEFSKYALAVIEEILSCLDVTQGDQELRAFLMRVRDQVVIDLKRQMHEEAQALAREREIQEEEERKEAIRERLRAEREEMQRLKEKEAEVEARIQHELERLRSTRRLARE